MLLSLASLAIVAHETTIAGMASWTVQWSEPGKNCRAQFFNSAGNSSLKTDRRESTNGIPGL
jgi:hypothetical protein